MSADNVPVQLSTSWFPLDLAGGTQIAVNGLWEIQLSGLGFSGLAAISFPGWWPFPSPGGLG
jgi:hypothetical protein